MAYPVSADVTAFLTSIGMSAGTYDFTGELVAIAQEFEGATNRPLFQSDGSIVTARYDPPHGLDHTLQLYIDDFYEVDSVTAGYSLTAAGTVLTLETDYWLVRENPRDPATPYVRIDFNRQPSGGKQSVVVSGKRGYAATCPSDLQKAFVKEAAVRWMNATADESSATKLRQGDREIEFDSAIVTDLHKAYLSVVGRYVRYI